MIVNTNYYHSFIIICIHKQCIGISDALLELKVSQFNSLIFSAMILRDFFSFSNNSCISTNQAVIND